jgi:hypothetical protein
MMRAWYLGVLVLALIGTAASVWAQAPPIGDPRDVSVGGVWVCRITEPALGLSPDERVVQMNKQITEALSTPKFRRGATIGVRADGPNVRIVMEHLTIVTITPADARGTTVKPMELARQWAQRLANGLSKALPDAEFHTF